MQNRSADEVEVLGTADAVKAAEDADADGGGENADGNEVMVVDVDVGVGDDGEAVVVPVGAAVGVVPTNRVEGVEERKD